MANKINISGIDRVELLKALWHNSPPAAFFGFNGMPPPEWNQTEAQKAVKNYVDYYCGRIIKCDLSGDVADTSLYNRDNGDGAFERIVAEMRNK